MAIALRNVLLTQSGHRTKFWWTKLNAGDMPSASYLGQNLAVTPNIGPCIVVSNS
jgi:hypothetical protein